MGSEQDHALWKRDRIELRSVGIDIGSSTSHLVFSTLELRRQRAVLSSRFELTGRRIDYESRILITPFTDGAAIDTRALSAFVDSAYEEAGLTPADLDTGAVIATGDAARKDNAEAIVRLFSEQAGKFVCASAGPLFEAKMAAYGSGAVARALGFSRRQIFLSLATERLIVAVLAIAAGAAMGYWPGLQVLELVDLTPQGNAPVPPLAPSVQVWLMTVVLSGIVRSTVRSIVTSSAAESLVAVPRIWRAEKE